MPIKDTGLRPRTSAEILLVSRFHGLCTTRVITPLDDDAGEVEALTVIRSDPIYLSDFEEGYASGTEI